MHPHNLHARRSDPGTAGPVMYYADGAAVVYGEDCLDALRRMPAESVDAIVTDPPYGLSDHHPRVIEAALRAWLSGDREHVPDGKGFMGRRWDRFVPPPAVWDECWRVLKPGGHLLAFAASRTADLMTMSIRLSGFEIRDSIKWIYAQGMPKSHDVSAAIDRQAGAEREVIGTGRAGASSLERVRRVASGYRPNLTNLTPEAYPITRPATAAALKWSGWGTALKPAHEVIVSARKIPAGTVAQNVLLHGTGALNVDGCRIPGRWPTNVVLSHAPKSGDTGDGCANGCVTGCPVAEMDAQSGASTSSAGEPRTGKPGNGWRTTVTGAEYNDHGGASRFFPVFRFEAKAASGERPRGANGEQHVSVKPLGLMRWLVRLVTQPGGLVVDPFLGSGTTAEACMVEGFRFVGMESNPDYLPLIAARLRKPIQGALPIFGGAA